MKQTNITTTLTPAQIRGVTDKLRLLQAKLPPLVPLTKEERMRAGRLGEKNLAFLSNCAAAVGDNTSILPESFDAAEFQRQVALTLALQDCVSVLNQITSDVQDTLHGVGSDAVRTSKVVYSYVKTAAHHTPGLKLTAERLSGHFSRARVVKETVAEKPPLPEGAAATAPAAVKPPAASADAAA